MIKLFDSQVKYETPDNGCETRFLETIISSGRLPSDSSLMTKARLKSAPKRNDGCDGFARVLINFFYGNRIKKLSK
jgi:hypothetical protein